MRAGLAFLVSVYSLAATLFATPRAVTPNEKAPHGVNIRTQPRPDARKIGGIVRGQLLVSTTCTPGPKSWCKVFFPDHTFGFASEEYLQTAAPADFQVRVLDVGSGQAAVITSGQSEIVIDGGSDPKALMRYLRAHKFRHPIGLVVASSPAEEHWGGLRSLISKAHLDDFWQSRSTPSCASHRGKKRFSDLVGCLAGTRTHICVDPPNCAELKEFTDKGVVYPPSIPGIAIQVLTAKPDPLPSDNEPCSYRIGCASLVLRVEIGPKSFLFASDITAKNEAQLVKSGQRLQADVLIVPRHGYEGSSSAEFIKAVKPAFAIISADSRLRVPPESVIERYRHARATILRTYERPMRGNDNIICRLDEDRELLCSYEDALE